MNISLTFIRLFYLFLSALFFAAFAVSQSSSFNYLHLIIGICSGLLFGSILMALELLFKRFNLRSYNVVFLGIFCGYLMGEAVMVVFNAAIDMSILPIRPEFFSIIRVGVFLVSMYIGTMMIARASDELYVSIPFVKFKPTNHKKKDVLIDLSALNDSRIIDLASSGLLDLQLSVPRFLLKELNGLLEVGDEMQKSKARRCLDALKKLENMPSLELNTIETDFPDLKDSSAKIIRLARMLDANILTADLTRVQQSSLEGIRIVNIHMLANALKPLTQTGEYITIKIQRYGKEPRQGVGYLDDGTMVVVNGGAEFIGDSIKSQVLSVKHTSSGRMIFCNALDENNLDLEDGEQAIAEVEGNHKSYFSL